MDQLNIVSEENETLSYIIGVSDNSTLSIGKIQSDKIETILSINLGLESIKHLTVSKKLNMIILTTENGEVYKIIKQTQQVKSLSNHYEHQTISVETIRSL